MHDRMSRLAAGLIAGGVAIVLNTAALRAADLVPLATAHGGLLRLVSTWLGAPIERAGLASFWSAIGGPAASSAAFQTGFHLVVGLLMAVFYVFVVEPFLVGSALVKGFVYAVVLWILNAAIVLPLTGEGFAGSAHLSLAGMIWFAAAHTLFFLLLAVGYAKLQPRPSPGSVAIAPNRG